MATIGLDVGGTKVLGVVLDDDDQVVAEHRIPTPRGKDAVLGAIVEVARYLLDERGGPVTGIGAGVPGLVDAAGVMRFGPNLPGVVDMDVRGTLVSTFGVPVRVGNDATCAGWGERSIGAARGSDHVLLVTLGTGIGGGLVSHGTLVQGANGFAGEIGHMVVDPTGPPCPCGKRGCWERYASGSGLGRLARDAAMAGQAWRLTELAGGDPEAVKGEHVTIAAAEGDPDAARILAEFAWWLALGLVNLTYIFDPECFVLGGGLIAAGDVLLVPASKAFGELLAGNEHRPHVRLVPAALGERAGAIGAALLAREPGIPAPSEKFPSVNAR